MKNTSTRFTLNGTDILKTLRGVGITLIAVAITAILNRVSALYQTIDYTVCVNTAFCVNLGMILIPLIGGVIEIGRRWVTNFSSK